MIGIYKITNKENGKVYIGQSDNIERRLSEHKRKRTLNIDDYINFLGVDSFTFDIIEECSLDELNQKEEYYIEKYDSRNNGYNIIKGGQNNSQGEGNGRSILTEKDVIYIRESYNSHKKQKDIYKNFENKITWSQFQAVWQGHSWSHIMPEVFTKENRKWYIYNNSKGENSASATLTNEEVLQYRKEYINLTAKEIFEKNNLAAKVKYRTFQRMLCGETYNYNIPVYKKKEKQWYLNGEPVSTISVSGE